MDRSHKFTDRLRRSFVLAEGEASRQRRPIVEPEHLLFGMLELGEGADIEVLRHLEIDSKELLAALQALMTPGEASDDTDVSLGANAKRVINGAVEEARRLNHSYVGKEHLLLSMARRPEGPVADVFRQFRLTLALIRAAMPSVLSNRALIPEMVPQPLKRYNLALPEELFSQIEEVARHDRVSLVEVIRRFVKLGLLVQRTQESGGSIILRQNGAEREIVIL